MARKPASVRAVQQASEARRQQVMRFYGDQSIVSLDLRIPGDPWPKRHASGKALREKSPREAHATWKAPKDRPDPLELLARSNRGRLKDLIPLRMGRMASSPFSFLRGAAVVMACDLAHSPVSGIRVVLDGDAHLNNFGLYGTPQRDIVFDLNDFDEAVIGPWEWDIKRLVASVNVAGRENGLNATERAVAVRRCVEGYRTNAVRLESMGYLDVWYAHSHPGRKATRYEFTDPKTAAIFQKAMEKAALRTNITLLEKAGERAVSGTWHFRSDPPILTPVTDEVRNEIIDGLHAYVDTLSRDWRYLVSRYHVVDVARRVVGVGSVGTRAYLVLMFGNDDHDPLFLQVKECVDPAAGPYLPELPEEFRHNGWRVVAAQHILQATSDVLLGFTSIGGRDYCVRQMKNMKGAIPIEWLSGEPFNYYAWMCGSVLARAHGRTGSGAAIAGYCGASPVLDDALAKWAEAYGNQNQRDYEAFMAAVKSGQIEATMGL